MMSLAQDVRFACRGFVRKPLFAAAAVLTLALGIGANTAIFSVADALLLRPLPYAQPDRLVLLSADQKGTALSRGPLSWIRFEQLSRENRSFASLAAATNESFNLTGREDPEQITAARVSWNFLPVLGIQPALGRGFTAQEDQPGGPLVALLSDGLWRRRFHADPGILGRPITLDQKDYLIIGVLPAGFRFDFLGPKLELLTTRVFELKLATPQQVQGGAGFLNYVGRLRDGVTLEQAQVEMSVLAARYRTEHPGFPDTDPSLIVRTGILSAETVANYRPAVLILFGAVGLVLLIACANVASLVLARALGRRREAAVRTAIGAGRRHIVRQWLTESVLLAMAGGAAGAALSAWATRLLVSLAGNNLPRAQEIAINLRVLLFTLALSTVAGLLVGLAPALQMSRTQLNAVLRAEGRGATPGRHRNRMLQLLVVGQVALSTVLLIAAALLLRNFVQLRNAPPGFDPHNLLTMNVTLPPARYPSGPRMIAFFDDLLPRVRSLPGVRAAAVASALPANPDRFSPALAEGQPAVPLAQRPLFNIQTFTPGYIEALRVPLLRGRGFTEHDGANDPRVALVNETALRRFWPHDNPIGKHIWLGRQTNPVEVVGVLGDVRNVGLAAETQPEIYLPYAQLPWAFMNLIVRTEGDPRLVTRAVRDRVLATDRDQPVTQVQTMTELLDAAAAQPRFTTVLLGTLSGTALLLALVGIYGVIAYSVAERTGELGVRIALGAQRTDILRLVLRQGLGMALAGIAIGVASAFAVTRLLTSELYHVSATDPPAFTASAVLFLAIAVLASYVPARRAMRVDPMEALRE